MVEKNPLVCVVAYNGLSTFEFGITVGAFGMSWPEFDDWYRFKVVAAEDGPLRAIGGISVNAPGKLSDLLRASLVVVPGWRGVDEPIPSGLRRALIRARHNGARIASLCSGAYVLAQCGFLDGKSATTHWRLTSDLTDRFPNIRIKPDVLYVDNGDILTAAGSAAGIDLCLHIIRRDFGVEKANSVARRMVMPAHRTGGQFQFVPRPVAKERNTSFAPLLDLLRSRMDEEWTIARMANLMHASRRTLLRRFKEATGVSPQVWLITERIERSKQLLETARVDIKEIAATTGFSSLEAFRYHFRSRVGISPTAYRTEFGIKSFEGRPTDLDRPSPSARSKDQRQKYVALAR